MKVLVVSSGSGSRGGGEIFLDYLGRGLVARGHEVVTWMPAHPRMDELSERCARFGTVRRSEYTNTYDHAMRSLATCFTQGTTRRVRQEWESLRPDVVHLNKQNLEDGLDLLRALRGLSLPSVCTIHLTQSAEYLRARASGLRDTIARRALLEYEGVFVAVEESRRRALDEFLRGRARTLSVLNGVPVGEPTSDSVRQAARREIGAGPEELLVLGLGRLVEQKRPMVFLQTAQRLLRELPQARFLWVGDGELSGQWTEWVREYGLQEQIRCVGWQENVARYLAAADLLLHTAEFEGLPLAILEAMAAGVPCAVTRTFAEEIEVFDDSNVLDADDVTALAGRLADRKGLALLAANARSLVEQRLSVNAMAAAYEALYREAIGR